MKSKRDLWKKIFKTLLSVHDVFVCAFKRDVFFLKCVRYFLRWGEVYEKWVDLVSKVCFVQFSFTQYSKLNFFDMGKKEVMYFHQIL